MKKYKYHYVYRITNIILNKHYYGTRSTNIIPTQDLGKRYFSSFSEKWFQHDQKNNPQNYKYKIIKIFETSRKDAIAVECRLHRLFDVKNSEDFFNKSNQTNTKFDTTGKSFEFGKVVVFNAETKKNEKINVSDISNKKHTVISKNKVSVVDKHTGKTKRIDKNDFDKNKFDGVSVGMVTVYDDDTNTYKNISKTEFHNGNYKTATMGTVTSKNLKTGEIKQVSKEEYYNNANLKTCCYGTISVLDIRNGKKLRVSHHVYNSSEYYVNVRSKKINIYDYNGKIKFESFGNFKKLCIEHNLPFNQLKKSYQNGGTKIYSKKPPCKKEWYDYINWYAKIID